MDVGQAVAQATLVAYDEGLGTCLMSSPLLLDKLTKLLKLPETATLICVMSVGYPAESWEAGGQTQKAPLGEPLRKTEYQGQLNQHDEQVLPASLRKLIQEAA